MASLFTWKVHSGGDVVAPDERLSWPRTIGIGMQHIAAMFGATFLVPILTKMPPSTTLFFWYRNHALLAYHEEPSAFLSRLIVRIPCADCRCQC